MTPEGKITKKIKDYLNGLDECVCWKLVAHPKQRVGLPDLIVCYRGRFVGLEVKQPSRVEKVTERQAFTLETIRKAGGKAFVVTSVAQVKKVFK